MTVTLPAGVTPLAPLPSVPAEPPQVGLLASLSGPYLVDDSGILVDGHLSRWESGFRINPEQTCYHTHVEDPCAVASMGIPPNPALVEGMPGLVWAGDRCSTFGWSARDYKGRATRALLASESKAIAQELWVGTQAQASGWPNSYLASAATQVLTSGPASVSDALALLEQGIADASNGQRGMIHCTRELGARWSELGNTFRAVNGVILTYMNTVIVPDAGYPGSGPSGQAAVAGSQWAYGTLMVTVRRSQIEVYPDTFEEAIIRGTNSLEFRAERLAAATFPPCCLVAVEVNLPVPVGGVS